ncbi:MAG TPA: tRNA (adenosine(37)-N6)-threonylcarbamoyltransferase complex dimerization subunit type 1 TsaB [Acidimicrobiales bacterium]|nr:tRNA (adenosine(37)-N6)-threonylcarbamoyltransferase complex dimerization subunit type 1 TsaB [Acidimicrobiales bacterium]
MDGRGVIILGIETATAQVGCAIGGFEGVLASFHSSRGRRHAETLVPAIQFLCANARVELPEISVVAVDVGPGLFTGLRVGIATAKSMASALRVPMIGLSSLDLLAHQVRHSHRLIVPVIDGKRGEVFSATYRHVQGGIQRLTEPHVGTAEELANELISTRQEALLVGDGALRYADVLVLDGGQVELGNVGTQWPSADDLVELAHPRAVREEFVQPWELEPLYLRKSDAEINWDRR